VQGGGCSGCQEDVVVVQGIGGQERGGVVGVGLAGEARGAGRAGHIASLVGGALDGVVRAEAAREEDLNGRVAQGVSPAVLQGGAHLKGVRRRVRGRRRAGAHLAKDLGGSGAAQQDLVVDVVGGVGALAG